MSKINNPQCEICGDSGSTSDAGYLDCVACDNAAVMVALNEWLARHPAATPTEIFQHGREVERTAAPAAPAVLPAGWKAVPITSTSDMDEAGWLAINADSAHRIDAERCWDAMLAAAPALPAAPVDESRAGALSETQQYRTGYGDGLRAAAKIAEEYGAHLAAEAIRNLQSTAPVASPVAADSEGWKENTGTQPVADDVQVEVKLRDGAAVMAAAGNYRWTFANGMNGWFAANDIIRWRLAPAMEAPSHE